MHRSLLALPSLVLAAALALGGCSDGDGDDATATDPAGSSSASSEPGPMPTEPVAADAEVVTRQPATVMDTGEPELCLGAIAESYPPQCGGPALSGWAWADHEGDYEQVDAVRWGEFVVTGAWDGSSLTVSAARAARPGDRSVDDPPHPAPTHDLSPADLADIAEEIGGLGGGDGAYATAERVFVDVTYDDGSLQAWADATYGPDVVVVTAALVDA